MEEPKKLKTRKRDNQVNYVLNLSSCNGGANLQNAANAEYDDCLQVLSLIFGNGWLLFVMQGYI